MSEQRGEEGRIDLHVERIAHQASGAFGLDDAPRPAGRLDLNLTGFGPVMQRMGLGLGPLGSGGQTGTLRLPVNVERGRASIGPLRLPFVLNPLY